MTEQELREKIIMALKHGGDLFHEYFMRSLNDAKESGKTHFEIIDLDKSMYDFFADALIADGICDVSQYKEKLKLHRVFVRKDGGDIKLLYGNEEVDEIVKEWKEYKHRAKKAERAVEFLANESFDYTYDDAMEIAEKELQEERKDD